MKKYGIAVVFISLLMLVNSLVLAQDNHVKTIYLFPNNFYEESITNLNEVRLIWNSKPVLYRADDMSEELRNALDKENLKNMMSDPETSRPAPAEGFDYRLYCIVTYSEGVNIYQDTSNIYIGFSPDNYMTLEYLNEKKVHETNAPFLLEFSDLLEDKLVRKSIERNVDYWKER